MGFESLAISAQVTKQVVTNFNNIMRLKFT